MSLDTVRVGVIGTGAMGRNHARIYSLMRDVALVGIADPDPDARDAMSQKYRALAFANYGDLLDQVDAVSIAVPTLLHHSVALDCLAAGLHVLIEKPIATDSGEAEEIISAAHRTNRVLQVGHIERFNPAVAELGRILLGENVLAIGAQRLSPPTPRITDVDVIFDLMIHDIDVALSLVGGPIVDLAAVGRSVPHAPLDHVIAHGRTRTGVIIQFAASKITHETVRRIEVTTERAFITVNYLNRDITVYGGTAVAADSREGYAYVEQGSVTRPHVQAVEPLRLQLEHFLDCVRSGAAPLTSGEAALAALRVAERIHKVASKGPLGGDQLHGTGAS